MSTDKLVAKIPSTATGIITAVNFGDDEVCKVGHTLISIEEEGDEPAAAVPATQPESVADMLLQAAPVAAPVAAKTVDKSLTAPPGN